MPPKQKLPITVSMLSKIRNQLNLEIPSDVCFWAACLIAFYGFLRKSTLLQPSESCDPSKGIQRSDITSICKASMSINIRNSKTIQFGQKVLALPFAFCEIRSLCPVKAISIHLFKSPLPSSAPLFAYLDNRREKVLTHTTFANRIKILLKNAGFDPKLISCHSFRRGGTSFAIASGMNSLIVKARGDWSSNAFERYVHLVDKSTFHAAQLLSRAVYFENTPTKHQPR